MNQNLTGEQKKQILKDFRAQTGYSLGDCKTILEEVGYDTHKARSVLAKKYAAKYSMEDASSDMETPE